MSKIKTSITKLSPVLFRISLRLPATTHDPSIDELAFEDDEVSFKVTLILHLTTLTI